MKRYLSLDIKHHNKLVAEIAETIKEYVPIGIRTMDPEYNNHPGIKKLDEIVGEQVKHYKQFISPWMSFLGKLKKVAKKRIPNTTYAHQWSYSAELILERYIDKSLCRVKKIAFAVSSIGPYFSICGIDETFIIDSEDRRWYHSINIITVSPYAEFENLFNYLETEIKSQFPTYKFVPFNLCAYYIKDAETHYSNGEECTVYNVLFNNSLDSYHNRYHRGDTLYGFGESNIKVTLEPPPPSH